MASSLGSASSNERPAYAAAIDTGHKTLEFQGKTSKIQIAYETLKKADKEEGVRVIGDVVHLNVGLVVEGKKVVGDVAIKTANMAKVLGKSTDEVKQLLKNGGLEKAISNRLNPSLSVEGHANVKEKKVELKGAGHTITLPFEDILEYKSGEKVRSYKGNLLLAVNLTDLQGKKRPFLVAVKRETLALALGETVDEINKLVAGKKLEAFLEKRLEKPPLIALEVRSKILERLDEFGLSRDEFNQLEEFYERIKGPAELMVTPYVFSRNDNFSSSADPLPRSLLYVPKGPHKGFHILLKSHGGIEELGVGGWNLATVGVSLSTGERDAFRTGKYEHVSPDELDVIEALQDYADFFAVGTPVEYESAWRPRSRQKNVPKADLDLTHPREEGVKKLGLIMPLYRASLHEEIPILSNNEKMKIAEKMAESLSLLHSLGYVHGDLKPENILLTEGGEARIGDFGLTDKIGASVKYAGTPGYEAPEVSIFRRAGLDYSASAATDIWSMGCILAEQFYGRNWINFTEQQNGNWGKLVNLSAKAFDGELKRQFPNYGNNNHVDSVIYRCLQKDPLKRITANDLSAALKKMLPTS